MNWYFKGVKHVFQTQHANNQRRSGTFAIFDDYFIRASPDAWQEDPGDVFPLAEDLRGGDHYFSWVRNVERDWFVVIFNDENLIVTVDNLKSPFFKEVHRLPEECWRPIKSRRTRFIMRLGECERNIR